MRKQIVVIGIVALLKLLLGYPWGDEGNAEAQETYSVGPVSAARVTTASIVITKRNGETCLRVNAVGGRTCTQAQACTAGGAAGGASCTAAQARTANVRIYPLTQAGREEFLTFAIALPDLDNMVFQQADENKRAFCAAWVAATNANKDTICTTLALPTGWVAGNGLGCDPGC